MDWYNLLRKISIVGAVLSIIFLTLSNILFYRELKNPKNSHKRVEETSLEKLMDISFAAIISTLVFVVITILTLG